MSRNGNPWTPEADEIFRQLWETGATAKAIGETMGRSVGSIVGRRSRLGMPGRETPTSIAVGRRKAAEEIKRLAPEARQNRRKYELRNDPPGHRGCSWIEGDPMDGANAYYCAAPSKEGSAYCATHHARAYLTEAQNRARANRVKAAMKKGSNVLGM